MREKTFRKIFVIFIFPFLFTLVYAQRLPVRVFTSSDGLGSSFVDFLTADSRGFLWFCTRDGLSRFDGAQFVTYQIGVGFAAPGIESIYETRGGVYWVVTTGGLYRFRAETLSKPQAADAPSGSERRIR
jgi:ligand-binding sensor domain-containing protein